MKHILRITYILLLFSACKKDFNEKDSAITGSNRVDNLTFTDTASQFGVFIQKAYALENPTGSDTESNLTDSAQLLLDSTYGAKNIRTEVNHYQWSNTTYRNNFLTSFKNMWKKGFAPALNIRWWPNGVDTFFADSNQYAGFVALVLDSISGRSDVGQHMTPGIVVVENEEDNPGYYINNNETELGKYVGMLRQAANACHTRSVPVTNGGIVCQLAAELTWDWLKTTYDTAKANTWARKVFTSTVVSQLNAGTRDSDIILGKYLVTNYKAIPYLSYINVHWYEPVIARYWPEGGVSPYDPPYNNSSDALVAGGIDSVVKYFNTTAAALKLITNETGQLTYSNTLTNKMVNKYVALNNSGGNFPIVIWYDGDADYTQVISGSKALHNTTSTTTYNLRTTGTKFKQKMH